MAGLSLKGFPFCRVASVLFCLTLILFLLGDKPASGFSLAEGRGIGARAIAMGGAFTAVADDPSAHYYNPAGLIQMRDHRAQVEYLMVFPRVYLERGDGPKEIYLDKPIKAPMLSLVLDISRHWKLPRKVRFGFSGYFPQNFKTAGQIRYGTTYDPYYPLYGDSNVEQVLVAWINGAVEIFPWLYLGGGFQFGPHAEDVTLTMGLDADTFRVVMERSRVKWKMTTEMRPAAGVLIKPLPRLRIGFGFRKGMKLLFNNGLKVEAKLILNPDRLVPLALPGFPIIVPIHSHYRPFQYAVGASYQVLEDLLLAFDLTYYDWRAYKDEMEKSPNPRLKAVLVPRFGLEFLPVKGVAVRVGYGFKPSPVDQQQGTWLNYVDNDVHVVSFGIGHDLNPFGWLKRPIGLSVSYQFSYLVPRTFDNVHPGEPSLRSSGYFQTVAFGIYLGF